MRVPFRAGLGPARATLSYPGLDGFNIVPAVIDITIEPASWIGWLRDYAPWGLVALLVSGGAWMVKRRRRAKAA